MTFIWHIQRLKLNARNITVDGEKLNYFADDQVIVAEDLAKNKKLPELAVVCGQVVLASNYVNTKFKTNLVPARNRKLHVEESKLIEK